MSVLVDTSVWIDHLRSGNETLRHLLGNQEVLGHPWVLGELAVGNLRERSEILGLLSSLPQAEVATDLEVLRLIEREKLWGIGIGYIDAQILAASRLSRSSLWTRDRRLRDVATAFGNGFDPDGDPNRR